MPAHVRRPSRPTAPPEIGTVPGLSPASATPGAAVRPGAPAVREERGRVPDSVLPAWPLLGMVWGYPIFWVLGMAQFAPSLLGLVMVLLLIRHRGLRTPSGWWAWAALLLWMLGSTVMLESATDLVGWAMRFSVVLNAGICALYFANARETVSTDAVLRGLGFLWGATVLIGAVALLFPDARLSTPMGAVMPSGLMSNDLVRDYVRPRLTETQQPWGAPTAYVRPSAPYVYANSWGLAYTLLTPLAIARVLRTRSRTVWALYAVLGLVSVVPAVASSNRGMLIGLGVAAGYVWVRTVLAGRWASAAWGALAVLLAGTALIASGALGGILGRQEYSDSTGGRGALYQSTLEWAQRSPLFGYGTTRMEPSVGVSMGTQGYVWTMLFCYGFVGLALFLVFLWGQTLRGLSAATAPDWWIHAVLVASCVVCVFYSFDTVQLMVLFLAAAMLSRARSEARP